MILSEGSGADKLLAYHEGRIKDGLGIDIPDIDRHYRHKRGEFTMILGHDNMGKTTWILWYFLCLSMKHGISWTVWTGENSKWVALVSLIQFYSGRTFKALSTDEVRRYQAIVENWFKFVDNSKRYSSADMLKLFKDQPTEGYLIDPFTGLDRAYDHAGNYEFLNDVRHFCNETNKTMYLSTHPNSESGRAGRLFGKGHEWEGHLMPPMKDHVEGGKPFSNRVDNVLIVHRLIQHREMQYYTLVQVAKIRETMTGGRPTILNDYIMCEWNSGLGFKVGFREGIDRTKQDQEPVIEPVRNFYEPEKEDIFDNSNTGDLPF